VCLWGFSNCASLCLLDMTRNAPHFWTFSLGACNSCCGPRPMDFRSSTNPVRGVEQATPYHRGFLFLIKTAVAIATRALSCVDSKRNVTLIVSWQNPIDWLCHAGAKPRKEVDYSVAGLGFAPSWCINWQPTSPEYIGLVALQCPLLTNLDLVSCSGITDTRLPLGFPLIRPLPTHPAISGTIAIVLAPLFIGASSVLYFHYTSYAWKPRIAEPERAAPKGITSTTEDTYLTFFFTWI
jgi:hypothetical protein